MYSQALQLYLEGLGFRTIGRFLSVIHVSVQKWIRKFDEQIEKIKREENIDVIKMDEMHTYIGNKKTTVGSGLLLIDMEKGLSTAYLVARVQKLGKNYES
jgi:transposase-like protein